MLASEKTLAAYPFYTQHWWEFFLFIQNWVFILHFPPTAIHLNHLWSIAIEEQFYLVFPFFLLLIRNRKKLLRTGLLLLCCILIARCAYYQWVLTGNGLDKIYWNTFFRLDALITGFILYLIIQKKNITVNIHKAIRYIAWTAILLLAAGIAYYKSAKIDNQFLSTFGFTLIAIVYGYLLYATILKKSRIIDTISSDAFLRYTGRISYGMYLIHWPLFLVGFSVLNKFHTGLQENSLQLINAFCCIPLTFLISHLSFKYFESFFLKRKVRLG